MNDIELIKHLWQKYSYRDAQGIKSDRKRIIEDYESETGTELSIHTLKKKILSFDREKLFNDKDWSKHIADEPTHVSERYVEISTQDLLDPKDIYRLHGKNPDTWELLRNGSTRSKIGTNGNDTGYLINTYQKAVFVPKKFEITEETLEKIAKQSIEPVYIEISEPSSAGCLEINFADLHFGFNDYEYYKPYQAKIIALVRQGWDQIIITTGGDMLHVDNMAGTTLKGTIVGDEEMILNGYVWTKQFMEPIIEEAISKSNLTQLIYIVGNHDTTSSWFMAKQWEEKYPQAAHDTTLNQWKYFKYKSNFIGLTHGAEGRFQDLDRILGAMFRKEMADCENIEVHSQDKHHEKALDQKGVTVRIMSSPSKMTKWIERKGHVKNRKAIECFVYDEDNLQAHYYVESKREKE